MRHANLIAEGYTYETGESLKKTVIALSGKDGSERYIAATNYAVSFTCQLATLRRARENGA